MRKNYNTTIERKQEQNKEVRNAPYSIEDESRTMNIHEEAIRNEGYEKAQKECLNTFIEILIKEGHSEEEARRMVEEEFKENK